MPEGEETQSHGSPWHLDVTFYPWQTGDAEGLRPLLSRGRGLRKLAEPGPG